MEINIFIKLVKHLKTFGYSYIGTIMANRIKKCLATSTKTLEKKPRDYDYDRTDRNANLAVTVVLTVSSCDSSEPIRQDNRWINKEKKKVPVDQSNINTINTWVGWTKWTKTPTDIGLQSDLKSGGKQILLSVLTPVFSHFSKTSRK